MELSPSRVFYYFEELSKIPHGSRNTKQISDYLYAFGKAHGLETIQDNLNNIIMIKPATSGYENADPIIIQGHMDMVCEKEKDCSINFDVDALDLYVDGDFLKARGTTLGGDDGIAVAYALALLESEEYKHPRLEVVITVDEEIGMLGAFDMDLSMLKGRKMLNIDSDVEGSFLTGCAGGLSLNATLPINRTEMTGSILSITVEGLLGGHSGAEIHTERGNANILMGRVLNEISKITVFGISDFAGGLKDNAIPRESTVTVVVDSDVVCELINSVNQLEALLKNEYAVNDPDVCITIKELGNDTRTVLDPASVMKVIFYLREVPNGVIHMSRNIEGLVETSLNLGILELKDEELFTLTSIRSSVTSRKEELKERVTMLLEMLGGEVEIEGDYPAWEYRIESPLRDSIRATYLDMFGVEPKFEAIHAGLECGIFSDKLPGLDCVSFGPNNYDIHTPKERLSISSTQRIWDFLVKFLEEAK